ncbi:MAG: DUF1499 domain-containing protein [Alphaproteobacteria bacterium]|nr:DUF1499 domain-containing protein [Alphaproteobacteria bacterium]
MSTFRNFVVSASLILSILTPVYFLVAALGTKFGLFDWRVGFGLLTFQYGPLLLMIGAGLALIALILAIVVPPRGSIVAALVALAIPAAGLGYGMMAMNAARTVPPIHDVSTDLDNPPQFSEAVAAARVAIPASNSTVFAEQRVPEGPRFGPAAGKTNAELQRAAFADIQPITLSDAPDRAYDAALAAARAQGWTITQENRDAGRIEATVSSFWYGFTDDIVVRVAPSETGSVIDVRSSSRVGVSDLGANAARIRAYAAAVGGA